MHSKKHVYYTLAFVFALALFIFSHSRYVTLPFKNKLAAVSLSNLNVTPPQFIIGVWYQPKENFQTWKDRGVNTLVGFERNGTTTTRSQWIDAARALGMFYIIRPTGVTSDFQTDMQDPYLLAWEQYPDEPDGAGSTPAYIINANYSQWKSQGSKPIFMNLDGARFQYSKQSDYQGYIQGADWIGLDYYVINRGEGPENLNNLGKAIDTLKSWVASAGVSKKIYVFIESSDQNLKVSGYFPTGRGPTADEMKQEITIATSHGANGIMYFPDIIGRNFEAYDGTPADVAAAMTSINTSLGQQNSPLQPFIASNPVVPTPIIANITSSDPGSNYAYVRWTTDINADAQVMYGLTSSYTFSTPVSTNIQNYHAVTLSSLAPDTTYHYSVRSEANGMVATSPDATFTTLPTTPSTSPVAPDAPPVIANVTSSGASTSTASFRWTTDIAADAQADFGPTANYSYSTVVVPTLQQYHGISVDGLTPNTTYHFRVSSKSATGVKATSADFTFTTLPLETVTSNPTNPNNTNSGNQANLGNTTVLPTSGATENYHTLSYDPNRNANTTATNKFIFTKSLKLGMFDPDVKMLQHYLNLHGFLVSNRGIGSLGKETDRFGNGTYYALIRFQKAMNINPPSGFFGFTTRTLVNNSR
jgi:hypothetical protein